MVTQQKVPERFWCVKQIDIFRDLTQADADSLAQITTFKQLEHGDTLSDEGVYLLKEGRIKIYQTPPEGEAITLDVLEPGEFLGAVRWEDNNAHPNITAEILTEAVVGIVTAQNFQYFLKRKPHLALPPQRTLRSLIKRTLRWGSVESGNYYNLVTSHQKPCRGLTNPLIDIAFRSPASRLALLLQNCADTQEHRRTGIGQSSQCVVRKISTKRLAQLTGSSIEKMETLLNQFKQHQIIEKRFRRIRILDPWQLKKIANAKMRTLPPLQTQSDANLLPDTDPATAAQTGLRNTIDS